MAEADLLGLVGSTVDQIRFDACIDTGGFGFIYKGFHLGRNEAVAIKCLRLTQLLKMDEELRKQIVGRFQVETKILQHLSQGNHDIVNCYASGEISSPTTKERIPYMVLEWLEGRTLQVDLDERRLRNQGGRTLSEALDLMESAALAIAHAHTQGVIHRDIKPGNLYLAQTRSGVRLKVLDFGLAKILGGESTIGQGVATMSGVHLCSPEYAAPEQFASNVGPMGPWTDVYCLTLVLLEVMRGEPVRKVNTLTDALLQALDPNHASPKASALGLTVPQPVEELLARALSLKPLERPNSVGMFWSGLRELARRSQRPVADANALAATAFDPDAAAAIQRVRDHLAAQQQQQAQAAQVSQAPAPGGPGKKNGHQNPFTGTLVMMNAPDGAPHRLKPSAMPEDPHGSTAPLVPPVSPGLNPTRAPVSPVASTVAGQVVSPLAPAQGGAPQPITGERQSSPPTASDAFRPTQPANPQQQQQAQQAQGSNMPMRTSNPPPPMPVPVLAPPGGQRGPGLVIGIIVGALLVIGAIAAFLLLRH